MSAEGRDHSFHDAEQPGRTSSAAEIESENDRDGSSQAAEHHPDCQGQTPSVEQRLQTLEKELEESHHRLLLAHAEVDNTRKRMRRDYEDQIKYANLPLVRDIVEVLDNLHRASAAAVGQTGSSGLSEGVAMVVKQFEETLARYGCRVIRAVGELFDPNFHEAISQVASNEHPQGVIVHEAAVGYQLHDRVVRPSQVIVSTGPGGN